MIRSARENRSPAERRFGYEIVEGSFGAGILKPDRT